MIGNIYPYFQKRQNGVRQNGVRQNGVLSLRIVPWASGP